MEIIDVILKYQYIQNAYIVGILVGFLAPLIGVYVLIKKMPLIVDGISHVTLAGISFAMMLEKLTVISIHPLLSGVVFSIIGAFSIEYINSTYKSYRLIAVPILITTSLSLMVLFSSLAGGFNQDLLSHLFGNILTTTSTDIKLIIALIVILVILFLINRRKIMCFIVDSDYSKFMNIDEKLYGKIFIVLISIIITLSIKVVGAMLIGALVIVPVSSAMKLSNSFRKTIFLSILISEISVVCGLVISYYLNIPSGASIVLFNTSIFLFVSISVRTKKSLVKKETL